MFHDPSPLARTLRVDMEIYLAACRAAGRRARILDFDSRGPVQCAVDVVRRPTPEAQKTLLFLVKHGLPTFEGAFLDHLDDPRAAAMERPARVNLNWAHEILADPAKLRAILKLLGQARI